jgi:hypothetical protein
VNIKSWKGFSAEQTKRQEKLENFWPIQRFNLNSGSLSGLNASRFQVFGRHRFVILGLILILFLPLLVHGDEEKWIFLPSAPLFQPVIGDPNDTTTSVIAYTNESRFEGAFGATAEIIRYLPVDQTQWAAGIFGCGHILFDEVGGNYPMQVGNWFVGGYLSESCGLFSNRFEYEHESSHLGDSLQGIVPPIIYNGENINFTDAFQPCEYLRLTGQMGLWVSGLPENKDFFESLEGEIYTPGFVLGGTYTRGYATADFEWKDELAGVFNKSFQLGVQWKFKKEESRDLRVALTYYEGNSEYGQFYMSHDEHVGIGVYFDP